MHVEELWTKTVNKIPIISPTIGLASNGFPWNMEPIRNKVRKFVNEDENNCLELTNYAIAHHYTRKCTFSITQLNETFLKDSQNRFF